MSADSHQSSPRMALLSTRPGAAWFDTSSPTGSLSPCSSFACEPALWLRGRDDRLLIEPGPRGERGWLGRVMALDPQQGSAWDRLVAIARGLKVPRMTREERQGFRGGFAGLFSYDLGRCFERIPERLEREQPWDFVLGLYDEAIVLDHDTGAWTHHPLDGAEHRLLDLWRAAGRGELGERPRLDRDAGVLQAPQPELDEARHRRALGQIHEHITRGDIYQANFTLRFRGEAGGEDAGLATFLRLREQNPCPYGAWLDLPGLRLASASPECFLSLDGDGRARSRPIKGTRARCGEDRRRDDALRAELRASRKDRAELTMIVDLVRNDLGRVCEPGSVQRDGPICCEGHPTVWHLVGDVEGQLAADRDAWDLVRACFPPGSCVGAPKIRAMQILEGLEQSRRGPYTGALGWIGLDGTLSLNVAIRTLSFAEGQVSYGVGGGIVYDSEPTAEWREALLKGRALARALRSPGRRPG